MKKQKKDKKGNYTNNDSSDIKDNIFHLLLIPDQKVDWIFTVVEIQINYLVRRANVF